MTGGEQVHYQLGSDIAELERLRLQGRALAPATRTIFEMAGIESGMRVLDLGSGAGDVSFLAADMVGPKGQVVGVDASAAAVAQAAGRAQEHDISNVRFRVGDIGRAAVGGPFDVVTGRLVLMYVSEPSAVLRTQATVVRPGGRVVPIEFDACAGRTIPSTSLAGKLASWIVEVFRRGGIRPALGPGLWSILEDAGLQPQGMVGIQPCFGPDDPDGPALLAGIVRTLLPLMERTGVATLHEVEPGTLQDRLSAEFSNARATFAHPTLYGAWATVKPVP